MSRTIVAAVAALALAALVAALLRIEDTALDTAQGPDRLPRYTLSGATLTRYDANGQPSLRATATELEYFDDESAQARELVIDVLNGRGTPWQVRAPSGRIAAGSRLLTLADAVTAEGHWPDSGEALTLSTPTLTIDPDRHLLLTDARVEARSRRRNGSATGLRANWIDEDLRLLDDVRMRYENVR